MDDVNGILQIAITFAVTVGALMWLAVLGFVLYLMYGKDDDA